MINSDSLLIIPTFNEKENVEKMAHILLETYPLTDILFIDDNSPDGTALLVKELIKNYPERIYLEERVEKLGLGTAYIHGFKWALSRHYSFIFEMDCDFSHNPADVARLKNACLEGADVAIGSRYCKGGKVENWPMKRILMSYFASVYVRLILWISIKDTTAGFKCYRADVLRKINLDQIIFKGYAFQICMKYAALQHKFKVVEVPITFIDRIFGESKMSTGIFKEAFFGVWKMKTMKL